MTAADHLILAPILIPILTGAIMLFYSDTARQKKLVFGLVAVGLTFLASAELLADVKSATERGGTVVGLYRLGDWPVPVGIVLVLDRLSAMMVMLTSLLAAPSLIYAAAGWHGKGQHYHSMFQFLLAGVNGAFLTGDLFNLFVFFEVMLAASYGLMLHGSGPERIKAGLHYIAINLAASLLFLIGVALVYGTTGTLNMADVARALHWLDDERRLLFHAAAGFLGLAFLIKAAAWPLCFWLPPTYGVASAPAAAIMAIMTKVGVYVILRLSMLVLGVDAGISAGFGAPVLIVAGMLTMGYGMVGLLATPQLARKGGYLAILSSGTVLTAIGFAQAGGGPGILSGALFYMIGSTAAVSAFFLVAEPVSRDDPRSQDAIDGSEPELTNATWAPMGLDTVEDAPAPASERTVSWLTMTVCFALLAAMLAGLPPLPGFIGKLAILQGMFGDNMAAQERLSPLLWIYSGLLIVSGLAVLIGLMRFGIRRFWADESAPPRILALELFPVLILLGMIGLQTLRAEPLMAYARDTASALLQPGVYRNAVLVDAQDVRAAPKDSAAPQVAAPSPGEAVGPTPPEEAR
ncbi:MULTISPECIES: monovalent cation/H+ antiporter subunit D [unclassified Paracoccus (in: a-proteobacteria)]|uniref:monovalent cation/H+ antiporter subunit D n=1 Tax=unclassified Paracoccus (in: a-proteobacteria) TaxID=2688777 RepID=UPI0012B38C88|nr:MULTISPECIES: monovalent cation/H+ antiporter subunit D [unclassified Paracoccus (in: a-proteobacteria)]UXU74678.1 monovalent cation/H+ antiporter subunit D [Paracoccus sp. SMMA_5]UXU80573.1 monovalent cation/H+ antiporter subunit D [Paracoccus sp. SMMA_5_TC]